MRRLKLFPKFFLYTLGIMLLLIVLTHGFIYLLAPRMQMEFTPATEAAGSIIVSIAREQIVTEAVQKALPISLCCSLLISVVCSVLLTRGITKPIQEISASTDRMKKLDQTAGCTIHSKDEIGRLAENINELYFNLLSTIEHFTFLIPLLPWRNRKGCALPSSLLTGDVALKSQTFICVTELYICYAFFMSCFYIAFILVPYGDAILIIRTAWTAAKPGSQF